MKTNSDLDAETFIARRDAFRKTPIYKLADFICSVAIPNWINEKTMRNNEHDQEIYDTLLFIKKKEAIRLGIKSDIMEKFQVIMDQYLQEMKESSNP